MNIREAQNSIGVLMRQHGLLDRGWTQRLDGAKNRKGQCRHGHRQLSFSRSFIEMNEWPTVETVALHEIAHALVGPGHGHDSTWRRQCLSIGGDGLRCIAGTERPAHKWVGVCPNCKGEVGRDRLTAAARQSACAPCCRRHNFDRFSADFLFVWKENHGRMLTTV